MSVHTYKNIGEFVAFLDGAAKTYRSAALQTSPRSHLHAKLMAVAAEYDGIADIVRNSNLVAVHDYDKAAAGGGVQ